MAGLDPALVHELVDLRRAVGDARRHRIVGCELRRKPPRPLEPQERRRTPDEHNDRERTRQRTVEDCSFRRCRCKHS
jgi:hypothetical protein